MESINQLAIIKFEGLNLKVYGTDEEPYVKCSDLLIHSLGYGKSNDANFYRCMTKSQRKLYLQQDGDSPSFNELGIYWAYIKSGKPKAEEFQYHVCQLLKNIRQTTKKQLEESKQESQQLRVQIEEMNKARMVSCYTMKYKGQVIYVGKDDSILQNRPQGHLTKRRAIVQQGNQLIDLFLATINEQDISHESFPCMSDVLDQTEQEMIEELKPMYNVQSNGCKYYCDVQGCARNQVPYKSRKASENHKKNHK